MSPTTTAATSELSFEDAYDEMKNLVDRLDNEEVPMSELFDSVAKVHGLGAALTAYLDEQKGRLDRIEAGEGANDVPKFTITASKPTSEQAAAVSPPGTIPVDTGETAPTSGAAQTPADDDIPF